MLIVDPVCWTNTTALIVRPLSELLLHLQIQQSLRWKGWEQAQSRHRGQSQDTPQQVWESATMDTQQQEQVLARPSNPEAETKQPVASLHWSIQGPLQVTVRRLYNEAWGQDVLLPTCSHLMVGVQWCSWCGLSSDPSHAVMAEATAFMQAQRICAGLALL